MSSDLLVSSEAVPFEAMNAERAGRKDFGGALRTMFPGFRDPALRRDYLRFHADAHAGAMRTGMVSAIVVWCMAWCMGALLRPDHADKLALALAVVLPLYGALVMALDVPRVRRMAQPLLAFCNITSGLLVAHVAQLLPQPAIVAPVGMVMVTFYAVLALRLRTAWALPSMALYNAHYLHGLHARQGVTEEAFVVQTFLLVMAMVGAGTAAMALEGNTIALFRQRRSMERQQQLLDHEHQRSERLLRNMLPASVAERLKERRGIIAERCEEATVLFADLVGFSAFSDRCPPEEVVKLLNELFSQFDQLVERRGLEKIKTIGDAYMVVAGIPMRRSDHAEAMAGLALAMQRTVQQMPNHLGYKPLVRIGIHSGPVVAGVIGTRRLAYDAWGDTVNVASRLQALARPGHILVSEATRDRIDRHYELREPMPVEVKGKGILHVFELAGERTPLARLRIA